MRHLVTDLSGNPIYTSFGSWRGTSERGGFVAGRSSSPHHHNPQSLLFLYIASLSWNDAIQRAQSHPQEVLYIDDSGNTPLHRACQLDPPVEVIQVLQDAVTQTNHLGATPLHIAASHRCNARTLSALIDLYPAALYQCSRMGRTPIHYACMSYRGLDLVAFQVLLEKTLEESRRKQQEHQLLQQQGGGGEEDDDDDDESGVNDEEHQDIIKKGGRKDSFKITDFIDIVREAKDGDLQQDDEDEISLLMGDGDSHFAMGVSGHSASSWMMHTRSTNDGHSTVAGGNGTTLEAEDETDKTENFNVVTWKDNTGNTPLGLLFRRYRERVRSVITLLEQMRNATTASQVTTSPTSLQTDLGHLWGKARLIVARLTEEQQQREHEESLAFATRSHQVRADDASSVGQQHWTAAAAWSKERFAANAATNDQVLPPTHAQASAVAAVVVKEDQIITSHVTSREGDQDGEVDSSPQPFQKQPREFRIVHASVGLTGYGCPPEMIRLAISIHPHQVTEMDEDGNLPLHIAASASSFGTLTSNIGMNDEEASVFSDSMASLFSTSSTKRKKNDKNGNFDTVIKMLLKQYPQAAQTPHGKSGRLPLVLAARVGHRSWDDGMRTLLRAYPPALFSGSRGMIPVKLYPHALALIGGGDPLPPPHSKAPYMNAGINLSSGSSLNSSNHSYFSTRIKGRGGMNFLHNLLISKQRQIRELTASASPTAEGTGSAGHNGSPFRPARQRNHVYAVPLPAGNGSLRPRSRNSSWSSNRKKSSANRKPMNKKIDPKLATTMFELLRTKPDLVEVGRSYHEKLKLERERFQASGYNDVALTSSGALLTMAEQHSRPRMRGNRTMSRSLLERMTVFERKTWK